MGAPEWEYDPVIGLEICEAISTSKDGLHKLCDRNLHWPKPTTIYKWIFTNDSFANKYAHARELQQEVLVHYMLERCENNENDIIPDGEGGMRSNHAAVQRDKLIADNIKWTASRLLRKKYGERTQVDTNINMQHESSIKDLA